MEHYILCASMFMCIACIMRTRWLACGDPTSLFQFYFARLRSTREPGVYYPQYVLTVFLFAEFRSVKYVLPDYVGLGPKLHTCIYLQFMCITFLCMLLVSIITQYKLNQFYSQYQFNKFLSVSIFLRFSYSYFFLPYYLLSFVAHLVLFTILGPSGGVPDMGLTSSGL